MDCVTRRWAAFGNKESIAFTTLMMLEHGKTNIFYIILIGSITSIYIYVCVLFVSV